MIGHHNPGQQLVLQAVMVNESVVHEHGDARVSQMAGTVAAVEEFLKPGALGAGVLNGEEVFPLAPT